MGESSVRPRLPFNSCSSLELDPPISAAEGGGPTSKLSCNKREAGFFVCTYPAARQKVGREKVFPPLPRSQKESFKFANCPSPPPAASFPPRTSFENGGLGWGVLQQRQVVTEIEVHLPKKRVFSSFYFFSGKYLAKSQLAPKRGGEGEKGRRRRSVFTRWNKVEGEVIVEQYKNSFLSINSKTAVKLFLMAN